MKKKPINIVLAIAFLGVWGLVIYQLVGSGEPDIVLPSSSIAIAPIEAQAEQPDSVALLIDYPDPFLKGTRRPRSSRYSSSRSSSNGTPSLSLIHI